MEEFYCPNMQKKNLFGTSQMNCCNWKHKIFLDPELKSIKYYCTSSTARPTVQSASWTKCVGLYFQNQKMMVPRYNYPSLSIVLNPLNHFCASEKQMPAMHF